MQGLALRPIVIVCNSNSTILENFQLPDMTVGRDACQQVAHKPPHHTSGRQAGKGGRKGAPW